MLLALRDFIKKVKIASIEQLSREFHVSTDALEPMLDIWINRGVVKKQVNATCNSVSCFACGIKNLAYYQWIA